MDVTSSLALDIVLAHWSNKSWSCSSVNVGDSICNAARNIKIVFAHCAGQLQHLVFCLLQHVTGWEQITSSSTAEVSRPNSCSISCILCFRTCCSLVSFSAFSPSSSMSMPVLVNNVNVYNYIGHARLFVCLHVKTERTTNIRNISLLLFRNN